MTLTEAVAYLVERRNHELAEESTDWALVDSINIVLCALPYEDGALPTTRRFDVV